MSKKNSNKKNKPVKKKITKKNPARKVVRKPVRKQIKSGTRTKNKYDISNLDSYNCEKRGLIFGCGLINREYPELVYFNNEGEEEPYCCHKGTNNLIDSSSKKVTDSDNPQFDNLILSHSELVEMEKDDLVDIAKKYSTDNDSFEDKTKDELIDLIDEKRSSIQNASIRAKSWRKRRTKKKNKELIDLSKKGIIDLGHNSEIKYQPINLYLIKSIQNKHYQFIPVFKGEKLNTIEELSSGSFGVVSKYSDKKNEYSIAVKDFKDKNDGKQELDILEKLVIKDNDDSISNLCSMINARGIYINHKKEIITKEEFENDKGEMNIKMLMDSMDGALPIDVKFYEKPLNSIHIYNINLNIIKEIALNVKCLADKGYYYTDMKHKNVLYKVFEDKIKLYFGDIGSIYCIYDDEGGEKPNYDYVGNTVWTFPPPEMMRRIFHRNIADLVWPIGVTLLWIIHGLTYKTSTNYVYNSKGLIMINNHKGINEYYNKISREIRGKNRAQRNIIENRYYEEYYDNIREKLLEMKDIEEVGGIYSNGEEYNLYQLFEKFFEKPGKRITLDEIINLKINVREFKI